MRRKALQIVNGSLLFLFTLVFIGCSKDSVTPVNNSRNVRFEMTGFSGSGEISLSNVLGQTVTINIYSDNKVVKTGSASVDSNQILILPSLSFIFS